jgi:hypothetical protein
VVAARWASHFPLFLSLRPNVVISGPALQPLSRQACQLPPSFPKRLRKGAEPIDETDLVGTASGPGGGYGVPNEAPVERRLAAILAGDVAGYSRLMGVDEVGTLPSVVPRPVSS